MTPQIMGDNCYQAHYDNAQIKWLEHPVERVNLWLYCDQQGQMSYFFLKLYNANNAIYTVSSL